MESDSPSHARNHDDTSASEELSGYMALGMKRQALRVARQILAKERISPIECHKAVSTLGMFLSKRGMLEWKVMLEAAFNRQSKRARRDMSASMLGYYCSVHDWENAARFISTGQMKTAEGAFMVMDVLLETKRIDQAKKLAGKIQKMLGQKSDRFSYALLITALAEYYQRVGEWDKALNLWRHSPLEEPFRGQALTGTVKIHLARALISARIGLQSLNSLKRSPNQDTSLSLPGNDDRITQKAEKALLRYNRGIEKLLPVKSRIALGFSD